MNEPLLAIVGVVTVNIVTVLGVAWKIIGYIKALEFKVNLMWEQFKLVSRV